MMLLFFNSLTLSLAISPNALIPKAEARLRGPELLPTK